MKKVFMVSLITLFLSGCTASNSSTMKFALAGAGTGAVMGASIADPDNGDDKNSMILGTALIGGVIGLIIGGIIDLTENK